MKKVTLTLFFLIVTIGIIAQDSTQSKGLSNTQILQRDIQFFRLMVVPNLSSYKEIKEKTEHDEIYKIVLHQISKSFEDEGFVIKDFLETLKISDVKYQTRTNSITDPFSILLENAPADIFIYVDISLNETSTGKQANLYLKAVDKYTADRYISSPRLQSTKRYWEDFESPALEALLIDDGLENFVEDFKKESYSLLEFGRKIDLKFESTRPKKIGLQMMVEKDKTLMDVINLWIEEHSVSSVITIGNSNKILRKEVYIPIFDVNRISYSPAVFGNELQKFLITYFRKSDMEIEQIEVRTVGSSVEIWFQ